MNNMRKACIRIIQDDMGIFNKTKHKIAEGYFNDEWPKDVYDFFVELINPTKVLSINMVIKASITNPKENIIL